VGGWVGWGGGGRTGGGRDKGRGASHHFSGKMRHSASGAWGMVPTHLQHQ
jgi:hypothetical protein